VVWERVRAWRERRRLDRVEHRFHGDEPSGSWWWTVTVAVVAALLLLAAFDLGRPMVSDAQQRPVPTTATVPIVSAPVTSSEPDRGDVPAVTDASEVDAGPAAVTSAPAAATVPATTAVTPDAGDGNNGNGHGSASAPGHNKPGK
jgi:hypothetical protein